MAFDKGHEKLDGHKNGTRNKGTDSIKTLLNTLLPEEERRKRIEFLSPRCNHNIRGYEIAYALRKGRS